MGGRLVAALPATVRPDPERQRLYACALTGGLRLPDQCWCKYVQPPTVMAMPRQPSTIPVQAAQRPFRAPSAALMRWSAFHPIQMAGMPVKAPSSMLNSPRVRAFRARLSIEPDER